MTQKKVIGLLGFIALLALLLLSACGGGGSEQPASGKWEGSGDFGTFTFTVNAEGDHVTFLEITLPECGNYSITSTFEGAWKGFPITDSAFSYNNLDGVVLDGAFSADGLTASGSWEFANDSCSYTGPFEAEFVE